MRFVLAAILWLCPELASATASRYAGLIAEHSEVHSVDPLLVVAVIHTESRFVAHAKSPTNDYGLMQLHVSARSVKRYRVRERLLFNPERNVRLGVKLLSMWRGHHATRCRRKTYPFWSHCKYGIHVPRRRGGKRVDALYHALRERFSPA